jgi:GT2 family glycosyltransferase
MMQIYVSIVVYKTNIEMLKKCIDSVRLSSVDFVIYIIDNSPVDDLRVFSLSENCIYEHRPDNPGSGAGHNLVIRKSLTEGIRYHLVINPDIDFDQDVISILINYLENNPDVAHVMPEVLNIDGSIQRLCKLLPTPLDLIFRRFLPGNFGLQRKKRFELWESEYNKIMFVPYLSGCFMLLRCEALKNIGIFDERFFMYLEDVDLSRRLAALYEIQYFPGASITHAHGAASYKSWRMLYAHISSAVKYFCKWGWIFDHKKNELNSKALNLLKIN